jgi:hypothetical protein
MLTGIVIGIIIGLVLGWNFLPQPEWAKSLVNKIMRRG